MKSDLEKTRIICGILKERFPNLTAVDLVDLAVKIVEQTRD